MQNERVFSPATAHGAMTWNDNMPLVDIRQRLLPSILFIVLFGLAGCDQSDRQPSNDKVLAAKSPEPSTSQSRAPPVSEVSESGLLEAFQSKDFDRVIRVMNDVKGSRSSDHLVPLLTALWNGKEQPGVDKDFASHPRVRIEIADALAQQDRNGFKGLDRQAFARYARGLVSSNDTDVARQAMLVLGIAGNADDMALLAEMAEKSDEDRFRPAVLALASNCATPKALIEKIEGGTKEQWRKDFVANSWEQIRQIRTCPTP